MNNRNIVIVFISFIFAFTSCNYDVNANSGKTDDIPQQVKEYFTFFDSGSIWVYQMDSKDSLANDTVECIYSKFGLNTTSRYRFFNSKLEAKSFPVAELEVYQNRILVSSKDKLHPNEIEMFYDSGIVFTTNTEYQFIDSMNVNGLFYNDLLDIKCIKCPVIKEIWIAPRIGIIKLISNRESYSLVYYNIILNHK